MLPKSHFRPLSRPRENGFVERSQNFVAASSMKSVHGLAKTRACEERYMADPSRSAGNLDPCRQGRQAELPAFGPRGCKKERRRGGTAASFAEPTDLGGEGKSQKARAKQHETGCGQRKETVGDKVVMAHVTPSLSDARPNLLKLSKRAH
jgi:hypothetical protein